MSVHRVTMSALFYGQVCQNVVHVDNLDGALTLPQIAQLFYSYWIGDINGRGVHQWQVQSIKWVNVSVTDELGHPGAPYNLVLNRPGVQSADNGLITTASAIIKFSTAFRGRKGRGRIYVPGLQSGFTDQGLISATFHTFADTALSGMKDKFLAGGVANEGLNLIVGPRNGTQSIDFHIVTNMAFSNFVGVQRRRNIGSGI